MSKDVTLRISRSKYIENSCEQALMSLDQKEQIVGQPMMVEYYTDSTQEKVDAVIAIGIKNGTGRDCFHVISTRTRDILIDVVKKSNAPDIVQLMGNQKYLVIDEDNNNTLYYCYKGDKGARVFEKVTDIPKLYDVINTGKSIYIDDTGKIISLGDIYTKEETDELLSNSATTILNQVKKYVDDKIIEISGGEYDLSSFVRTVNYIGPDSKGNVNIKLYSVEDTSTLITPDSSGNFTLNLPSDDMMEYLRKKLAYTYEFTGNITSDSSYIAIPNVSKVSVDFIANISSKKSNDASSTNVNITSVSNLADGWTSYNSSLTRYIQTINIDTTATSVNCKTFSITATNADGKSGVISCSPISIELRKPWYIFEDSNDSLTDNELKEYIEEFLSSSKTSLKTDNVAINKEITVSINTDNDYLYIAVPNTLSLKSAEQLSTSIIENTYNSISTSYGTYKVYKTKLKLSKGNLTFNLNIEK